MSGIAIAGSGGSGSIVIGTTTIGGGTDTCVLFQKGTVVGEDTNLEWDYTNHILNLGPNARLNSIGTTWEFDVGGVNVLDYGVTIGGEWTAKYWQAQGGAASFVGLYVNKTGDGGSQRGSFALDGNDNIAQIFGVGTAVDTKLASAGVRTLAINGNNTLAGNQVAFQVYNITDVTSGAPTNYERGVFDWTTTSNVLTIGTQKGGSGSTRNIQFVAGGTTFLDWNITSSANLSLTNGTFRTVSAGQGFQSTGLGFGSVWLGDWFASTNLSGLNLGSASVVGFSGSAAGSFTGPFLYLAKEANGIIELANINVIAASGGTGSTSGSTTAGFHVYNIVDVFPGVPTNYERATFDFGVTTTNVLTIGTQKGGSGSTRNIQFVSGPNNFMDWSITQSSILSVTGASGFGAFLTANNASGAGFGAMIAGDAATEVGMEVDFVGKPYLFFGPGNTISDLRVNRQGVAILGIQNNTNTSPAALHILATSDVLNGAPLSNYERFVFDAEKTTSNTNRIMSQAGGTGTVRIIAIDGFSKAGAAVVGDIPAGTWALIHDTSGATTKLCYNDAGTLRTVALT